MHCTSLWPAQNLPLRTALGSMGHIKKYTGTAITQQVAYQGLLASQVLNRRSCPYLAFCLIALSLSLGCIMANIAQRIRVLPAPALSCCL
jgi:hypothetical protein